MGRLYGMLLDVILFAQLPERHGAGCRHIERIHLVGHGDLDRVIAGGDGGMGQTIALGAQHDGKLGFLGQLFVVADPR